MDSIADALWAGQKSLTRRRCQCDVISGIRSYSLKGVDVEHYDSVNERMNI